MKGKLAWLIGIGLWMVSLIVVLGSLVLSLSEGGLLRPNPSEQQLVATTPADYVATPEESEMVLELPPTATFFPSPTRTATETATPVPTCAYPAGWIVTTLPAGVSLETLALQYGLTPEQILQANCLTAESLGTKSELYLPAPTVTPTATETERPRKPKATQTAGSAKCGPPASWVIYIIQKGDTLYSIAVQTGTTVADLQWANCLGNSTMVRAGQKLYVPRLPQGKPPAATQKPPKPPKATIPSGPGVTPIVVTPLPTASP
ncbi:MAG: LysM peptidoglycan-binding domain-containing protein [Anaerolineales bacterium]|nr:LysM peptidoglycan-binding domain-containing protein [Anaerolineales bacterium]